MITSHNLSVFFQHYVSAFTAQHTETLVNCYQIPCTLSSPDNVVLISTEKQLIETLVDANSQINQANIAGVKLLDSSYQSLSDDLFLVNIGWQLLTQDNQVYTEFCAIYYVAVINNKLKIININSQELSQSLNLANTLTLKK